jgi:4-phytase/acid phosphatase
MILPALLMLAAPATAAPMTVERVAILMRHGVRPPTKDPAMPAGIAAEAWPRWDVKAGYLTQRGAKAIALTGAADRKALSALMPAGACPAPGAVSLYSDSDQRTIATGDAWAAGFAPGCATITNVHRPQDEPDPDFNAIEMGVVPYDAAAANAAVKADLPPGGVAAVEARERAALARVDAILCGGPATGTCGILRMPSGLAPAKADARPKLTGALDRGSTAAQILLLEYADGKPMREVGWGRATRADIALLGSLHATEFALLARPRYIAARNIAPIAARLRAGLAATGPDVTMIVGHDTDIANLGGLLGLHWQMPGFAADDPAPGGAITLTLLRDGAGQRFVRADYRAQPLEAIRALEPDVVTVTLDIAGCPQRADHLCPAATFDRLLTGATDLLKSR